MGAKNNGENRLRALAGSGAFKLDPKSPEQREAAVIQDQLLEWLKLRRAVIVTRPAPPTFGVAPSGAFRVEFAPSGWGVALLKDDAPDGGDPAVE